MKVIVPLAGPGFENQDGSVKSEYILEGEPLLVRALNSRSWANSGLLSDGDYVFILQNSLASQRFAREKLSLWYPNSQVVFLPNYTAGAAFSALAGLSVVGHLDEPIGVDLADILYRADINPVECFESQPMLGGIALTFSSQKPEYSYLALTEDGLVTRAKEKKVISENASAGTYWFRDSTVFLKSVVHAIQNRLEQAHNGLFFICPLFNGVIESGYTVAVSSVTEVQDIKFI